MGKIPIEILMGFNIAEYKSSLIWFDILKPRFKKLPSLTSGIISKKNIQWSEVIKIVLTSELCVYVRPHFLHILQTKQHIAINPLEKEI